MEILPVPVRCFPNADAARTPKHPLNLGYHPLRIVEQALFLQLSIKRNQQHNTERISPGVAQPIRPNALRAHPVQLVENIGNVFADRHSDAHTPKG